MAKNLIFHLLKQVDNVVFSRLDPVHKGKIALLAKKELGMNTLAIGDALNDASMLKVADVSIKIEKDASKRKAG